MHGASSEFVISSLIMLTKSFMVHRRNKPPKQTQWYKHLDRKTRNDIKKLLKRCRNLLSRDTMILEDEKPVIPGVVVRAGTVSALVETCVLCFDITGRLHDASPFPRVFLLMHPWFITSAELANYFFSLYRSPADHVKCGCDCKHDIGDISCERDQFKSKVCHAIRYWITTFPQHFDLDKNLSSIVCQLRDVIEQEGNMALVDLVDMSKVPSFDWMRNISVRHNLKHIRKVSLVFNHLDAAELADHLSYLEYKAIRRLSFADYQTYAMQGTIKNNPRLERSIALFNSLSQWLQCMILSRTTAEQRADVMVKFIHVAKRLRQLQNFNTLMAVVGGLSHSAIARLTRTHACVPLEAKSEYTELLSSASNFSNYRKALSESKGFKVPILGVHLKDLISLHAALPDHIEGNLVNFRKIVQLYGIFNELMQVQSVKEFPLSTNMDLINTLRLSLDLHYTEDEIYELSLAKEPKTSISSPCQALKPPVFADWAAGVITQPDHGTLSKHVNAMVEAVFKNYDHDRDGFISQTEFDQIASNFPFIDSFCVLDADKDGMISKEEMKKYFVRANCYVALRKGFKHDFHEATYFKPTFCIHCTGLLWGLIKQGQKCKDCGINAHKHCKDSVVMECRRQPQSSPGLNHGRSSSFSSADLSVAMKRKLNQRSKRRNNSTVSQQRGTQTDDPVEADPAACVCRSQSAPEHRRVRFRSKSECVDQLIDDSGDVDDELLQQQLLSQQFDDGSQDSLLSRLTLDVKAENQDSDNEFHRATLSADSQLHTPDSVFADAVPSLNRLPSDLSSANHNDSNAYSAISIRCYDDDSHSALLTRLSEVEEERGKLQSENVELRSKLECASEEVRTLREHINIIREHTVTFILNQMDTFNIQKDTQV